MTDTTLAPPTAADARAARPGREVIYRHTRVVRLTHWINVLCISLLLMSGLQIFNAHPQLYWGQTGADFDRPIIAMVADDWRKPHPRGLTHIGGMTLDTTGVLGVSGGEVRGFPAWATFPGQRNLAVGRNWHFFLAWLFVGNGLVYLLAGIANGHLRRDLAPTREQLKPSHIWRDIVDHIRLKHPTGEAAKRYNVLQKFAYLSVIAVLLPMMVLTGLTMSPGFDAFAPALLDLFGGRQSARTLHFICANLIVLFIVVHVVEVILAGVFNEIGSMITGRYAIKTGDHP
ncbi:MAG: cytochrome b/b6 domain-containing protein [Caulobacteraceae bacterium]|nr:cytochrome b/b6 domain-containing protein [Caulobacteraceae bacterium]